MASRESLSTIRRWPYEDTLDHLQFHVSSGEFAGTQEVYAGLIDIDEFASRLCKFPRDIADTVTFEAGAPEGNVAYHLRLHDFLRDRSGHAALAVAMNNMRKGPHASSCNFHIWCEVAALNQLGSQLLAWCGAPTDRFSWATRDT